MTAWNELAHPGLKLLKLPGCALRVLVGGQHAGAIWFEDDTWHAEAHGLKRVPPTSHETSDEALAALLRSGWARRLGARAASRVFWSPKASKAAKPRAPRGAS